MEPPRAFSNESGFQNSFFGDGAGFGNTFGTRNTFIGKSAGQSNITGNSNTALGVNANVGASNLSFATAIGAGAVVNNSNRVVIGRSSDRVEMPGIVRPFRLDLLQIADGQQLCISNGSFGTVEDTIVVCGIIQSPSLRHKIAIEPFTGGLEIINRLRPISFTLRDRPVTEIGLAAEDVANVEPLLATHNRQGQVEGVKYDQLNVVLINAIKEQQRQIDSLKRLVCLNHPNADACK